MGYSKCYYDDHVVTCCRKFSIQKGAAPHVGYFMISDDEVQQFQFTKRLYSARSQYQQIDIFHSNEFGAMLFLDFVVSE